MDAFWVKPLIGGVLIGISSLLMLALLGRIAGISGILAGCMFEPDERAWRYLFVGGVIAGPVLYYLLAGGAPPEPSSAGWGVTVIAGLLVGYGTRLGSGCTSGHGVCGIGRLSLRSIVATATFMAGGFVTVFVVRHLLGGG